MTIHTIPVPKGWSAEQAWESIVRGEELKHPLGEPDWAVVEVEGLEIRGAKVTGGRLVRWFPAEEGEGRNP